MNLEELKTVRTNPMRMSMKYLKKHGWFDWIMSLTAGDEFAKYNMRDRVDFILAGCVKSHCYCGGLLRPGSKYCSPACVARDPINIAIMSAKQKANAAERWEKTKKTNLEKYGVAHNQLHPEVQAKTKTKKQAYYDKLRRSVLAKTMDDIELAYDKEYVLKALESCTSYSELMHSYFGGLSKTVLIRHIRNTLGIEHYYQKTGSYAERQIAKYVETVLRANVVPNDRKFLDGSATKLEIDVLCHDQKIAIEYDGVWFHAGDEPHLRSIEKRKSCERQGYQFIRIMEYEWEENEELVKSILSAKFGVFERREYARKCSVQMVDSGTARKFLNENHLQGYIQGTHFGLYLNDELLSLFTLGKIRFKNKEANWELLRYATIQKTQVVGGFSKLLSSVKKSINGENILTYCDVRWSNGKTYEKHGTLIGKTSPGYCWIHKRTGEKLSRHKTQKHKLPKLLGANFDAGKTEKQNMEDNNYLQIWDDGNLKFML